MRVEPRSLIRRLTPTSTRLMESAVGRAVSLQQAQVGVEHLLAAMVEQGDGDLQTLVAHLGVDGARLRREVDELLASLRAGHSGRPVFSDSLLQLLEHAWLWASLEQGETRLRSAAIVVALHERPTRYLPEGIGALSHVAHDEIVRAYRDALGSTEEAFEAVPELSPAEGTSSRGTGASADGALAKFTHDLTAQARAGQIDPALGRHRETRQLIDILARRRKNNPILVGEPGVGKTALVEALAQRIVDGDVPETLRNVVLRSLDLGMLQAGASVRGEFEQRLKAIIHEVKSSAQPIVLFIDEAHTLIGAGGNAGGADAANLLKPALARGELRTIAATTWSEYKKYFEKDPALARRFQPVQVDEPGEEDAITMLRGIRERYEQAHQVTIRDEALQAAVKLSRRYLMGRQLPDKAVDLLDTASARVRIEQQSQPEPLRAADELRRALQRERELLHRDVREGSGPRVLTRLQELEQELESAEQSYRALIDAWEAQRQALRRLVDAQTALRHAHNRSGESTTNDDLPSQETLHAEMCAARQEFEQLCATQPLMRPEVDAMAVATTLASWTGIPVGNLHGDTRDAILSLEERLRRRVVGQDAALKVVAETLKVAQAGIQNPEAPLGVLLFVGPSGVGKTETALALADALYGGERALITINLSEYQEKHSVSRLVGSPPGYVGYGEGGVLTEAVRQKPYSAVLLDECEKADLDVMNLFYQVFDKGTLSDGEGRLIDFRNTIIILTSNLASDQVAALYREHPDATADQVASVIGPALRKHFGAALVGRMHVIPYRPLNTDMLASIVKLKVERIEERIRRTYQMRTDITDAFVQALVARCTESESGARQLDQLLRGTISSRIATTLLQAPVESLADQTLRVDWSEHGDVIVELTSEHTPSETRVMQPTTT
jgi:type VI secretion system protein VasG